MGYYIPEPHYNDQFIPQYKRSQIHNSKHDNLIFCKAHEKLATEGIATLFPPANSN